MKRERGGGGLNENSNWIIHNFIITYCITYKYMKKSWSKEIYWKWIIRREHKRVTHRDHILQLIRIIDIS